MMIYICVLSCALFFSSNVWFYWRVLRPIKSLSQQAELISHGDFEAFQCPCGGVKEVDVLRRAMVGMVGHVRRAQEQTRVYADHVTLGQEQEKGRVARELHDDIVQALIVISQQLDMVKQTANNETVSNMLKATREHIVDTITSIRNLIGDLRPPALSELGLVAALKMQADKYREIAIHVDVQGEQRRLDEVRELTLFRVVQEALNNAQRHGKANEVKATVDYQADGSVMLRVVDNGLGFDQLDSFDNLAKEGHYGLLGIQERVKSLNGTLSIKSHIGKGATLQVLIPDAQTRQPLHEIRDPVCSAVLKPEQAYGSLEYQGERYYFCCPVCQGAFQRSPETYLTEQQQHQTE